MHYQVSRNGQMYGPYTLEDLQRYLASGNVLATDLAKSEEMADWVPVSELVSTHAALSAFDAASAASFPGSSYADPATFANQAPYGAPAQNASLAASQYPDAPNLHWGLYLLFAVLTCGIFSKVFTLIQAAWLKRVQPNSTGLFFYIGLYILWIISLFFGLGRGMAAFTNPGAMHRSMSSNLISLVYFILLIVTRFIMSASLEEHFNGPENIGLRLNPVLTFFFGGVYFQSQLNRINAMKQAARFGGAPRTY